MDPKSNPSAHRVGLRQVAAGAGVCLMTASLSLRDSPKISAATRTRVREVAERLGYRPDAEISRLMGRLRASRLVRGSVAIALIDLLPKDGEEHFYTRRLRQGVIERADALGFSVDLFRLRDYGDDARKMMRVIRSRGIVGGVLLPSDRPVTLPTTIWNGFSVVAATSAVVAPRFHCVVPNQLYNTMALIERMHERGYSKVGAIITESLEKRTAHCYSLALIWHGHGDRILILEDQESTQVHEKRIAAWLKDHAVDVIFAQNAEVVARTLRSGARRTGLVSLSTIEPGPVAYQDEMPDHIGESAVSLLAGMMHNNETDVPEHPRVTTVDGVFRDAPSVRRKRSARAAVR